MTDEPERKWYDLDRFWDKRYGEDVEYTRADLAGWRPIETAPKDGTPHVRGLWVHDSTTGKRKYWQADSGYIHDEHGYFISYDGDDFGWNPEDYTHWLPLPAPPEEPE